MKHKLKINRYDDRMAVVKALANAGYAVTVEEVETGFYKHDYYVVYWNEETK